MLKRGVHIQDKGCYTLSPAKAFSIRGRDYLKKKKKYAPDDAMFELVGVDTFKTKECIPHPCAWTDSVYQRAKQNYQNAGEPCPRFIVINFMCPADPDINLILYFAEKPFEPKTQDDHNWKRLLDHFMDCSDLKFCKKRLKLIPLCVKGPWLVKKAMGSPALIAKKIETSFHKHDDSLEISIDVGSSSIAKSVLGNVSDALTSLVIDLGFTIEGKLENELPERLIGGCRVQYVDLDELRWLNQE